MSDNCPTSVSALYEPVMHKGLTKTRSAVTACLIFTRVVALRGPIPTVSALKRDTVAP